MLFPFGDNLTAQKPTIGVVVLLILMLVLDLPMFVIPSFEAWSVQHLGFIPLIFSESPWSKLYTLVASVFLHADLFHLLGNALFLWVFGRSLERLVDVRVFLIIFPALGVIGLLAHWVLFPNSPSPVIGASGAIATLMGAYLALFPRAKMRMFLFLGIFFKRFQVPAWAFLFYWIGFQFLSLMLSGNSGDNVAYAVHIGGFATGLLVAMAWKVSYPFADERLSLFSAAPLQRP